MAPAPSCSSPRRVVILTNLAASVFLALLIGLGVHAGVNKLLVDNASTDGFKVVSLDTASWNVACTVIGTAIGVLTTVAFTSQNRYAYSTRDGHWQRGVAAIFLRSLTVRRGTSVSQLFHFRLPLETTILVRLANPTALKSVAVVSLFGVCAITDEILNPTPAFPLSSLDDTFFETDRDDGASFPAGSPVNDAQISQLSGFLYCAGYIEALRVKGLYNLFEPFFTYLPEQGLIGDTTYQNLGTRGVGLKMTSDLQYSRGTNGFDMLVRFQFNKLDATVFGTSGEVTCQTATVEYSTVETRVRDSQTYVDAVGKNGGGPNIATFNGARDVA